MPQTGRDGGTRDEFRFHELKGGINVFLDSKPADNED